MNPIVAGLVAGSEAVIADGDGRVWRIRRLRSADLADAGLAEIVGAASADKALQSVQAELRASQGDPVRRAEIEARAVEAQQQAAMRALALRPGALAAIADRMERVVCAGVVGVGVGDGEAGALVEGAQTDPVRLVMTATTDADHEAGRVWVGAVPEPTRMVLFDAIEALCGATTIRPFRGLSRGADPA